MSEVEQFFYSLSKQFGVSYNWQDLDPLLQMEFVNGVNNILRVMQVLSQANKQE